MFLSTGVFRILHDSHCEFGKVHHLLIHIERMSDMTPRKSTTFISLGLKQLFVKVTKPSSVSPFKQKAYILFSSLMLHSENSVNIWNLLWLSRRLIIITEEISIYISTFPNAQTSERAQNREISIYFFQQTRS